MADQSTPTEERPRYVFFVTGPSACGKSTIAEYIADQLHFSFLEGDDVSTTLFPGLQQRGNLSLQSHREKGGGAGRRK